MNIQLYHRWHCPYSARVRDYIDENKLVDRIKYIELSEVEGAEEKLNQMTGRSQVPCLVVEEKPMLESDEIVRWLGQNLVSQRE